MEKNSSSNTSDDQHKTIATTGVVFPTVDIVDFQKVSICINSLIAILGFIAGIYYFFKRLKVESDRDQMSRIRERTKIILSYIDDYDKEINGAISGQQIKPLSKDKRDELIRLFRCLQHSLESNQALIKFSEPELQTIQEFHSVIDNSKLMRGNYANEHELSTRSLYVKSIKEARAICWKKSL